MATPFRAILLVFCVGAFLAVIPEGLAAEGGDVPHPYESSDQYSHFPIPLNQYEVPAAASTWQIIQARAAADPAARPR